ncbi:MAG: SsrA-binding protein SmpB [Thermoanaerobaculaceae bacterium]
MKVLATNRKARFAYEFLERFVAGVALTGSEVKSVREGKLNLQDGYVTFEGGEAFLVNVHISPYANAGYAGHEPLRPRKLLLHKREIKRLMGKVQEKGLTLIPLAVIVEGNWIKVELALAKGKKTHDKKQALKERDLAREAASELKHYR